MTLDERLQRLWYGPAWRSLPLWPLAAVFALAVVSRRWLYRTGVLRSVHVHIPVVVVGNITIGGTGKTPVAAWLARQLTARGHRVGVVLRGYGGTHRGEPRVVMPDDDPKLTGDEALVHARRGTHVVVIGADRVAAASKAAQEGAEVVVCDDGLQHARLARDYEIVVIDGSRGLGNGWMLPAGPLRDPASRLEAVNAVVLTDRENVRAAAPGGASLPRVRGPMQLRARLQAGDAVNVLTGERRDLRSFAGIGALHAVAGTGHPEAFFSGLQSAGLEFAAHALPDHAPLNPHALPFPSDATVLMTEKDAVKCRDYAQPTWWWVTLGVGVERDAARVLLDTVLERTGLTGAGVRLG
jgi:tetraacyldisaccharide 4'-kinase